MAEGLSKEIAERKIEHNRKALGIDVQVIVQSAGLSENEIGDMQTKRQKACKLSLLSNPFHL